MVAQAPAHFLRFGVAAICLGLLTNCAAQSLRADQTRPARVQLDALPTLPLGADLYLPAEPATSSTRIVLLHGGGWRYFDRAHSHATRLAKFFARHGHPTYSVSYPQHPKQHPEHAQHLAKVLARLHAEDPSPVLVAGVSSGAQIASLVALDRNYLAALGLAPESVIAGVMAITGVFDLQMRTRNNRPLARRLFENAFGSDDASLCSASPQQQLRPTSIPFFVLSARHEPETLRRQAWTFVQSAKDAGIDVSFVPDLPTGHLFASYQLARRDLDPWAQATLRFVETHSVAATKQTQNSGQRISSSR